MSSARLLLDANVLALFVTGRAGEHLIDHPKSVVAKYTIRHFRLIQVMVDNASRVVTNPYILAETSNLIRKFRDAYRAELMAALANFIKCAEEMPAVSLEVSKTKAFGIFGLTDAAVAALPRENITVLTDDGPLCQWLQQHGFEAWKFSDLPLD